MCMWSQNCRGRRSKESPRSKKAFLSGRPPGLPCSLGRDAAFCRQTRGAALRCFQVLRFLIFLAIAVGLLAGIDESLILPASDPKIGYASAPLTDRATQLGARLRSGAAKLTYQPDFGYLVSLLRALDVPAESQVLVFSKTSFQAPRIAPRTPRAIYHSADVSVGFVHGGDVLEIAAVDPQQGVVFYSLDQEESARPRLVRREECMHCHVGTSTLGVPGLVVRSVHADRNGQALLAARAFVTDHRSALDQRWGGWYVTGASGAQHHLGNQTVTDPEHPAYDPDSGSNLRTLQGRIDTGSYLAPGSDIVSLMVLEHQTRFTNLVTRLGWESRLGRPIEPTAAELVRYLLFADETALTAPIEGGRAFAEAFARAAVRDGRGRSLRDFDLKSRMFRYRCSYLIHSPQFDGLPAQARELVWKKLNAVLRGAEPSHLGEAERQAILEILQETGVLKP
jgi:hypothetical protein